MGESILIRYYVQAEYRALLMYQLEKFTLITYPDFQLLSRFDAGQFFCSFATMYNPV